MEQVWFEFGNGPQKFEFKTGKEMAAFLEGISTAAQAFGIDDYRQFDTEEEVQEYLEKE